MESKKDTNLNDKIPKERRKRTKETEGKLDDDGYFYTPNGSFWDMDGEYFNRHGFDIHGGKYINKLDYIPGPTWIEELGCYPEDEEQYKKEDIDDDIEDIDEKDLEVLESEVKGINLDANFDLGNLATNNFGTVNEDKNIHNNNNNNNVIKDKKNKKNKNKKKNKKKKDDSLDEDEWEEIED